LAEDDAPELLLLDAQAPTVNATTAAMTPTPPLRHNRLLCLMCRSSIKECDTHG
jgi:hypothetical protein